MIIELSNIIINQTKYKAMPVSVEVGMRWVSWSDHDVIDDVIDDVGDDVSDVGDHVSEVTTNMAELDERGERENLPSVGENSLRRGVQR